PDQSQRELPQSGQDQSQHPGKRPGRCRPHQSRLRLSSSPSRQHRRPKRRWPHPQPPHAARFPPVLIRTTDIPVWFSPLLSLSLFFRPRIPSLPWPHVSSLQTTAPSFATSLRNSSSRKRPPSSSAKPLTAPKPFASPSTSNPISSSSTSPCPK